MSDTEARITPASARSIDRPKAMRYIAVIGIAAVAVVRLLVVFSPELYFDVDPAHEPSRMAGLGPAGSLLLDALLLLCCACGLLGESLTNRTIEWKLLALALLPLPIVVWHGIDDFGNLWRGMTWQAAVLAGVVAAHLVRDQAMRVLLVAVLIAAAAPLLARGLSQVTVEHAQTVAGYEEHREAFLRDRGWEPDSAAARVYERRLRQPQPLGWFSTSNIFAAALLPMLAVAVGLAVGLRRAALPSGWMGLMILLAAASFGGIAMSRSKGAIVVAMIAIAIVAVPLLFSRWRGPVARFGAAIFVALPCVALAGVIARGFLPEGFLNERSLLFRWHYLLSSLEIFTASPLRGVGPDGYQEAYTSHRLPRNPEEVVSSHSMFIDWLCMLGVLGLAWSALTLGMLMRASKRLVPATEYLIGLDIEQTMRQVARVVMLIVFIAIAPAIMTELHVLDAYGLVVRILGAVAFAAAALVVAYVVLIVESPVAAWSFAAGAAAIVMHGQIEMTFYQPGFVVWAFACLGTASGAVVARSAAPTRRERMLSYFWPAVAAALALWIVLTGFAPAVRQQIAIQQAAAELYPLDDSAEGAIAQRRQAAHQLVEAYRILPSNHLPLQHAARQLARAATITDGQPRLDLLVETLALADQAVRNHPGSASLALRYRIAVSLAALDGDEKYLTTAISDAERFIERDPNHYRGWMWLGDALWMAGRTDEAREAYRRALRANEQLDLDPLRQLGERDRRLLESRLRDAPS